MKSSSFHTVSADKENLLYKIFVRLVYFPLNRINNLNPNKNIDPKLQITKFAISDVKKQYHELDILSSPSRKLSDLFWNNYNWIELENDLGQLNVCDLGCGSGHYYDKIQNFSQGKISQYTGLDIYENKAWKERKAQHTHINFKKYDGRNILNEIPKDTNLLISQSGLEHFIEDITIFKQIRSFVQEAEHPVYQIHLIPSKACLELYQYHGVRQYTPRNISKITRLFSGFSTVKLIELGGKWSNQVHKKYLQNGFLKKDIRKIKPQEYEKDCLSAIQKDFEDITNNEPSFYALIIKTPN